eukprot:scaffold80416_cov49-Tisochrysis_lutea.AAC.3
MGTFGREKGWRLAGLWLARVIARRRLFGVAARVLWACANISVGVVVGGARAAVAGSDCWGGEGDCT